jgi:hypothetical protein
MPAPSRGVDRVDPVSGSVKHFSMGEGLASDFVTAARRDRNGAMWFGTMVGCRGWTRSPKRRARRDRRQPFSSRASAPAGTPLAVSELGDVTPAPFTLEPSQNQLEIGYFGFSFESGEPLKYQYRLEGTEERLE